MAESSLLPHLAVVGYGVLGTQLTADRGVVQVAPEPGAETVIVDPAGLPFIQKAGPSKARGASGAIYAWLGIQTDAAFPEAVREAIKAPGHAKFQSYGDRKVIHVVGPDLRRAPGTSPEIIEKVVALLAVAYANTLKEFLFSGAECLRVLPISGGIFAGRFAADIPWMTFTALERAYRSLAAEQQSELLARTNARQLELCLFGSEAVSEFQEAYARGGHPPAAGPMSTAELWPGALALISGLESEKAKQFNDTICTVLGEESAGKHLVLLENAAKATLPTASLSLAEGGALLAGSRATVMGLESEKGKQYNGTVVELKAWSKEHSKWLVKLADGSKASLPAPNLRSEAPCKEEPEKEEYPLDLF